LKPVLLRCAIGLCLLAALHADNYPRQPGIDVQHYRFAVTLSDDTDEIAGETTVEVLFVKDGVAEVSLDLAATMQVSEVSEATYRRDGDRLVLKPSAAAKAGEHRRFTVKYRGTPKDGLHAVKNKYGERCFFSANWPDLAHQWLPTVDHPYDKATSEFVITAPAKYQVVANGRLEEEIDLGDGRRLTHWKESVPIATWLNNIGVAQFASMRFGRASGVPLETWVFPKDRDAGIATFNEPMRQSVEFFSSRIGPYPYEKLAAVQNGEANGGGMEHASAIFYGQNTVTGRPALGLVSHEIAHQWFGDSVTEKDWDDVWLSEGFATYFSALTIEHYEGRDAFAATMRRSRDTIFNVEKRLTDTAVVQTKAWSGIPNGIVYQKGAWTLHMLRAQMGDARFRQGIRAYYRRYRDSNASTADFVKVMEEAAGADLGWFFRQWLYRPGSPAVEARWRYDSGAKKVTLELTQAQPGEPYRLPIEIAAGATIKKVELTDKKQRVEIAVESEPAAVTFDPNVWLLAQVKVEKR
jgi:aminopeptidase N